MTEALARQDAHVSAPDDSPAPEVTPGRPPMKRVATAAFVGSAIEWYDFFLFGTASALVFGQLFFPGSDPMTGTLLAFGTFGVGFFARPVGGIVAGHLGDRVGRKKTLVATLLLMGLATAAIGLLPTYATVGVWAPLLLVALRVIQGLGVGGEWGGAALLAVEHAPARRRGYYGAFPQMGVPAGLLLASAAFAAVSALPDDALYSWGWRIPFLLSFALVGVGLFIRLAIAEPESFRKVVESGERVRRPIVTAVRDYPREVLLAAGIRFADNVIYYVFGTFALTYIANELGLPRSVGLIGVLVASALELFTMPFFGALSDRVGRRPVVLGGALFGIVTALPYFWLTDTGNSVLVICGAILTISIAHAAVFTPLSAWFSEMFGAEVRYSGISIGFQLGALVAGAPTPFIAVALLSAADGSPVLVAALVMAACAVTAVSAYLARGAARPGPDF